MSGWFVYILECADGTYYTGITNDLERRLDAHNKGQGAKYTKPRLPVSLVYQESYDTKSESLSREIRIKSMARSEKIQLILSRKP